VCDIIGVMARLGCASTIASADGVTSPARLFKVEPIAAAIHSEAGIEPVINSLGRESRAGLVVMPDGFMGAHRVPIISLAARNNVPAVYAQSYVAKDGGLLSYGPDT
jgi:putative tryptophan/tyrosine transport system substrate-binding protein